MVNLIEFKIFAPRNQGVILMGNFPEIQEIEMQKGKDGYFRTKLELADGIYEYKFRVKTKNPNFAPDEWVNVIDPYATEVDENKHIGIIRIKNGQKIVDDYIWQNDHIPLPQNHQLLIYEMHVADFIPSNSEAKNQSKYASVISKLDYLAELGINALQLMPVNEYPGNYSWGYRVRHFFATESSYGSTSDFKKLVDECHRRGIRVLLDGIYNHSDDQCPLIFIDRNYWYYADRHYPGDNANYWGPEFNYDTDDQNLDIKPAWKFIGDVVQFWVKEYHIDGIRFDALRQLANWEFIDWLVENIQKITPKPFYSIGEHIPERLDIVKPKRKLDGCWHESFRQFILPTIIGEKWELEQIKQVLNPQRQGYTTAENVINYLASHDRPHLLRELGNCAIFGYDAFTRAKLASVLLITAVGVPMLWMGEEFGEYNESHNVNQPHPLNWSLLTNDQNHALFQYYQKLITLRKENQALQTDNIEFFHENPENQVLAYVRWNVFGNRVVVIANFSHQDLNKYQVTHFPQAETWRNWSDNSHAIIRENTFTTDIPRHTAKILIT